MARPRGNAKTQPPRARAVLRLVLLWQGTVLDVVTLKRAKGTVTLRTGEALKVRAVDDALEVQGLGDPFIVEPDVVTELPAGHALIFSRVMPEARVGTLSALDSTAFHAAMIAAAVQACVVSAFVLAPAATFDTEPGAGMPGPWRRYLVAPGGTAPHQGPAMLNHVGRPAEESERINPVRRKGSRSRTNAGKNGPTVTELLAEMSRALRLGNDGTELKEAIGALAQAQARAPVEGAGFGGLAPKDPTEAGVGNGAVGPGESKLMESLRRRLSNEEKKADKLFAQARNEQKPVGPVQLMELPEQAVKALVPSGDLDPVVKDAVRNEVTRRKNALASCYQDRGLPRDTTGTHKLVLNLTLLPDGHVTDVHATVDDPRMDAVVPCVVRAAKDWYLRDGLVDVPTPMSFPFVMQQKKSVNAFDFSNDALGAVRFR